MAIRIRKVKDKTIALCAAKTKARSGDLYLDDVVHHALNRKFYADYLKEGILLGKGYIPRQDFTWNNEDRG